MTRVACVVLATCVVAGAAPAGAQQSIEYASVSGRVTDPSGAVIVGASVMARQAETNAHIAIDTDKDGRFRFPYLRVGPYELTIRHPGFAEGTQSLELVAGAAFELPVVLTVAGLEATVTVTAQPTALDTARSQLASTVSETEVRALPMNGRNVLELALLVPGVSPANIASTQLFPETSAVAGVTLSVSSQRNLSNNFLVDGLSANDDAAGLSGMVYGLDAVDQFQVVTSGGQAELGRALGGYISVVTKSGTNRLGGTLYNFVRDDRFNAANPLSGTTLPMSQAQYGASLGGPLVRDRTFYFANLEQRRLDQTGLTTIAPAAVDAINARLATVGYQGPPTATGLFKNPIHSATLFAKIDHRLDARDQLSVRYSRYAVDSQNARGAGGLNAPSASSALDSLDQSVALSNTLMLSSRTVLESRVQIALSDLAAPPTDLMGPAVAVAGVATFGRLSSSPTGRVNRLYQVVNNLSHQAGAHAFRVGADVLYNDDRIAFPRAVRGSYTFSSLANFLSGVYNNLGFTQTFGASDVAQGNQNLGVYAQDEWKLSSSLTMNLGLRYDLQFLETITTDTNNVAPRLGVAWSPVASRQTVVRANFGLFYDRVPLRALANALLSAGNTTDVTALRQLAVSLSPTQAGAPVFPGTLDSVVPSVTLPNLTTMDRQLQNAYSRQTSVEIEHELGKQATVSAGYQHLRGHHLLMAVNQNVPACVAVGTNNGCRPNPSYANNNRYSSVGGSTYHGLQVSVIQRPVRWGHYRVSYTLSKAMNNLGEFFFSSPIDPFDLSKDWGRSDNDQRHRLVVSGAVQTSSSPATTVWERLTHGFQLSGVAQTYSALPFNVISGVTTIQGTAGRPRVDGAFIPRNQGESTPYLNVSARLSRTFRLTGRVDVEALVEGFNLTNHQNVVARNGNFGPGVYPTNPSSTFGQVTAVGEPRSWQFGARVRF